MAVGPGEILTSTLLDQVVTPAVFYKFGKPAAGKIIAGHQGKLKGKSKWDKVEKTPDEDAPPFAPDTSKPVLSDWTNV